MKNENYEEFIGKFERKKTSDDCYTPENIYEAVAKYVEKKYGYTRDSFVRPFYPDKEYREYDYPPGCVVVDNPPFSILSQIMEFYNYRDVKFFLFSPALTTLSCKKTEYTAICTGVSITYENGAEVSTSFVTNLENTICRSDPDLYFTIERENKYNRSKVRKQHPKYSYPNEVLTAAKLEYFSKHGVEYSLERGGGVQVSALDAQKPYKKTVFGSGYLLSEKAAAEKAAAEKAAATIWKLSEAEKRMIENIGKREPCEQLKMDTGV